MLIPTSLLRLGNRLAGKRADPTSAPAQYASPKERTKQGGNCVLEASAHQSYACEDEAAETDHGTGIHRKRFERCHEGCGTGHINRALCVSRGGEGQGHKRRSHRAAVACQFL